MPDNSPAAPDGASPDGAATHKTLADDELDRAIRDRLQMINRALADHDRAIKTITQCEKSAVLTAWRLGGLLAEKKGRLEHGRWLPWLESTGISSSSAADYMRLAREISSAGNLKSSIRATLQALPSPSATPKPKPTIAVKAVKPATATPKTVAVKIVEPDLGIEPGAETISALEKELYGEREKVADLEERIAIILEAADPEIREAVDKLNNQAELIRTLKAQVADWQAKAGAARKEAAALKRKIKTFEKELAAA